MPLPRLETGGRVGDQVFDAIRAAIMSGELPAGFRLRIRDLAEELGTSVMPVREAIRRLEEIGLAEAIPYRGAVVKEFTDKELLDLYAVRRLLEVEATRAGVPGLDAEGLGRMEDELGLMRQSIDGGDAIDYLAHDEAFLAIMYAGSGNDVLLELIRTLWDRCRTYKAVGARRELDSGDPSRLLVFQEQLLRAARDGEAETAGDITAASLDAATMRIEGALRA
ncbi:GntR family transcriptional regulator [Microbacterium sp. B2969]|uniref:GntR family transcriptional regulator n=1 Tax=Microbacterium alkaliflavum TaxID=3248839 RepID=A0ABW7QCC6_9MICO